MDREAISAITAESPGRAQNGTEAPKFRPRACVRCGQSKLKCTWPTGELGTLPCERCAKAKTECLLPSIRSNRPRRVNHTRVGKLEQKLDGIMSLLTASQQLQQNEALANGTREGPRTPERSPPAASFTYSQSQLAPVSVVLDAPVNNSTQTFQPSRARRHEIVEITPTIRITYNEADHALDEYRSTYYPLFPFVPIADNVTADDLCRMKPLLFRTVVQVAVTQSPRQQQEVKRWFREYIAQHMVVQMERRLEILQAILVFIAWTDYGFYVETRVTNLLQLASAIVIDLGLSKPPRSSLLSSYSLVNEAATVLRARRPAVQHTLEDMRAVLGCFYLNSTVSSFFRRMHTFPFTAYLNRCCDMISEAKEYAIDAILVALIQIQRLVARIHATIPNADADPTHGRPGFHAPVQMAVSAIRRELDDLAGSSSPAVGNSFTFRTAYHAALIRIYEPAIYMRPSLVSGDGLEAARRTECLWSCLQANNNFVDAFLNIPTEYFGCLPSTAISHLSFCLVTTSRLLFLQDADWEVSVARKSLDFASITSRMEERFQAADLYDKNQSLNVAVGRMPRRVKYMEDGRSEVHMSAEKMRWMRHWYLSKLPGNAVAALAAPTTAADPPGGSMEIDAGFESALGDVDAAFWDALLDLDGFGSYPHLGLSSMGCPSQGGSS